MERSIRFDDWMWDPNTLELGNGSHNVSPEPRVAQLVVCVLLKAILALVPTTGWSAQGTDGAKPGVLEEVLVTARRREELPIDVPMALTYLDGATLDGLQYRDIAQILSLSPGVVVYTGSSSQQLAIRGVVAPGPFSEPGNSTYVDEVYSSGVLTVLPGFYDIQSVQVLKGPQAGLYGRNTIGGAVLITTAQPTDERFGRLDTSYAEYGAKNVNGTANLPLSDTVRLRATAWYSDIDGGYYQGGVVDQDLDSSDEAGGRLTLAWLPNERTSLMLSGESADIDASNAGFIGVVDGAEFGAPPLAPESRRNILRDDLGDIRQEADRISGKLETETDVGSFIAVAGWRKVTRRDSGSDADGTALSASYADFLANPTFPNAPFPAAPKVVTSDARDTSRSADLRFITPDSSSPVRAVIGASYYEETVRFYGQTYPVRDFAQILATLNRNGSYTQDADQKTASWAGFTELIWTPSEPIEVTMDLRYTRDRKELNYNTSGTGFYYTSTPPSDFTLDTAKTFDNWSPGITFAYKPVDALTVFAKYVRGFRAGGFNGLVNNPDDQTYDSEEAENYEIGFKSLLLDQRLNVGASIFYQRINNAVIPVLDFGALGLQTSLQNTGSAETTGLEIDLTAQVTEELSLIASAGTYQNSISGDPFFSQRPFAPDHTASLAANYEHPLSATVTGIARLGFRHRSGGRIFAPGRKLSMDSYNLLDAQLGVRCQQVEFAAFVRNALDDNYEVYNNGLVGIQSNYLGSADPRAVVKDPGSVFGVRFTVWM
ncbi:MAG: TonB-dependent receptor [Halioglobus sp.]|nr:TonB-dependent receptor [Halioglobus sp.]